MSSPWVGDKGPGLGLVVLRAMDIPLGSGTAIPVSCSSSNDEDGSSGGTVLMAVVGEMVGVAFERAVGIWGGRIADVVGGIAFGWVDGRRSGTVGGMIAGRVDGRVIGGMAGRVGGVLVGRIVAGWTEGRVGGRVVGNIGGTRGGKGKLREGGRVVGSVNGRLGGKVDGRGVGMKPILWYKPWRRVIICCRSWLV